MKRIISNKILFVLGTLMFLSEVPETSAQVVTPIPKDDSPGFVASTTQKIDAKIAEAQEYVNSAVETYKNNVEAGLGGLIGDAKSKLESLKALQQSISETVAAGQAAVEAGKSLYNDTTAAINEATSSVTSTLNQLQTVYQTAQTQLTERQNALTDQLTAKNTELTKNITTLKEMAETATDDQKTQILNQISTAESELAQNTSILGDSEKLQEYLNLDQNYADLSSKLSGLAEDLKTQATDALGLSTANLSGLFGMSDADRQQEYTQVITDNFLGKDEADNMTTSTRVMKHRYKTLYDDTAYAITKAVNIKKDYQTTLETVQMHQQNAAHAEYAQTSLNMLIQSRIDDVKILSDYTTLLIAGLRRQTAAALVNFPTRYTNYDRDPSVLNLDDYKFTEDDILTDTDNTEVADTDNTEVADTDEAKGE